ncbi:hypothetical protein Ddc_13788 [Ditylenchus destructor]|nr:hypothetical protein Ddc_13788 [Ditylenchus destructor]
MRLVKCLWLWRNIWKRRNALIWNVLICTYQTVINSALLIISLYILRSAIPTLGHNDIYYHSSNPFQQHLTQHLSDDQLNRLRVERAEKLLLENDLRRFKFAPGSTPPRMAIAITASDRRNLELVQMMGFISAHITSNYPLSICNTELAGRRPHALRRFENVTHIIDVNANLSTWRDWTSKDRWLKEAHDYWNCMNSTLETLFNKTNRPDYLLVLEDDTIPIPLFEAAINSVMNQLDLYTEIDYVKLYKRWDWRGIPSAYESFVVALLMAYLAQITLWHNRNVLVIAAVVAVTQVCWRMYFRELISDARFALTHHVVLAIPEECCTQAVLFRSSKVPQILKAMWAADKPLDWPKDLTLDKSDFVGRRSDINLVVHVGYFSYIRQSYVSPEHL